MCFRGFELAYRVFNPLSRAHLDHDRGAGVGVRAILARFVVMQEI